jgi:hypothetical protein
MKQQVGKLGKEGTVEEVQGYCKEWHAHVGRMHPKRLSWHAYFYHPDRRRDSGHPGKIWTRKVF